MKYNVTPLIPGGDIYAVHARLFCHDGGSIRLCWLCLGLDKAEAVFRHYNGEFRNLDIRHSLMYTTNTRTGALVLSHSEYEEAFPKSKRRNVIGKQCVIQTDAETGKNALFHLELI